MFGMNFIAELKLLGENLSVIQRSNYSIYMEVIPLWRVDLLTDREWVGFVFKIICRTNSARSVLRKRIF